MTRQYVSIAQLAELTPWSPKAIRRMIQRGILREGVHYTQPFGWHTQIIFRWDAVRELIESGVQATDDHVRPTRPTTSRHEPIDPDEVARRLRRLLGPDHEGSRS